MAAPITFSFSTPPDVAIAGGVPPIAVSPDGRFIAFVAQTKGTTSIWLRPLGAGMARQLPGTENVSPVPPIWSPDSRFLAFGVEGRLRKAPVTGGPPVTIPQMRLTGATSGSWSQDDIILLINGAPESGEATAPNGLSRVSAGGGAPTAATTVDRARGETQHMFPVFLPDGRHFLFLALKDSGDPELKLGALDSTDTSVVMNVGSQVAFSAGHLLFWHEGSLMAQPFDPVARRLSGEAMSVADGVAMNVTSNYFGSFSASVTGVLAYGEGTQARVSQLSWFDRAGKVLSTVGEPDDWRGLALSRDDRQVVVTRFDESTFSRDLWTIDRERKVSSRLTFDASVSYNNSPAWSPDGKSVAFHQTRTQSDGGPATGVYLRASSGKTEFLMGGGFIVSDWSADGQYLAGYRGTRDVFDVWAMPLAGDRKPFALMTTRFAEQEPSFSPDVRWIAYSSNESGPWQVFVEPFPATGSKFQVSRNGGRWPTWRGDGKELFFLAPDGTMMAATLAGQEPFASAVPRALFPTSLANVAPGQRHFAVAKDGQRFLINNVQQSATRRQITVVVNWPLASLQPSSAMKVTP